MNVHDRRRYGYQPLQNGVQSPFVDSKSTVEEMKARNASAGV